jgi:hypothetical protein
VSRSVEILPNPRVFTTVGYGMEDYISAKNIVQENVELSGNAYEEILDRSEH